MGGILCLKSASRNTDETLKCVSGMSEEKGEVLESSGNCFELVEEMETAQLMAAPLDLWNPLYQRMADVGHREFSVPPSEP
jgi:hypothetical protein